EYDEAGSTRMLSLSTRSSTGHCSSCSGRGTRSMLASCSSCDSRITSGCSAGRNDTHISSRTALRCAAANSSKVYPSTSVSLVPDPLAVLVGPDQQRQNVAAQLAAAAQTEHLLDSVLEFLGDAQQFIVRGGTLGIGIKRGRSDLVVEGHPPLGQSADLVGQF